MAKKTTKPAAKKTTKPAAKKTTKPAAKKVVTVENEMKRISLLVEKAKKSGKTSIGVFKTKDSHHKTPFNDYLISVEDLKDVYRNLYYELICKYKGSLKTRPIDLSKREIEWFVDL